MPLTELLMEGVNVLLLGMSSVFLFLAILVTAMTGMSCLARRLEPEQPPLSPRPANLSDSHPDPDEETIAVISAAIGRYRS